MYLLNESNDIRLCLNIILISWISQGPSGHIEGFLAADRKVFRLFSSLTRSLTVKRDRRNVCVSKFRPAPAPEREVRKDRKEEKDDGRRKLSKPCAFVLNATTLKKLFISVRCFFHGVLRLSFYQ